MELTGPLSCSSKECEERSDLKAGLLNKEGENWDTWEGLSLEADSMKTTIAEDQPN